MKRALPAQRRGFTLIELMVVVALVAVVAAIAVPSFRSLMLMQRLKSISAQVVTDMQFARSEAISRNQKVWVRFTTSHPAFTCYVLFTGPAKNSCNCRNTPVCNNAGVEVRTVLAQRDLGVLIAPSNAVFPEFKYNPVTGGIDVDPSDTGVVLVGPYNIDTFVDAARRLRTTVSPAGRPSNCTPVGSTMSEPACLP